MDKTWIHAERTSDEYKDGVIRFIDHAFVTSSQGGKILCPCTICVNQSWKHRSDVFGHLLWYGFNKNYVTWVYHGEESYARDHVQDIHDSGDDMYGMLHDAFGIPEDENVCGNVDAEKFYRLIEEANVELYPGCKKFSKLSFIVRLFHIKCLNGMSNSAFNMILQLLKEAFPEGEKLPKNYNETKKIMKDLGLEYKKIHACPNDCMLYWKEDVEANSCHVCGASRWKVDGDAASKIPAKVLRHFPLQSRLQRLFMCSKTAHLMRWHEEQSPKDGKSRHPVDGEAWKSFDSRHTTFASEPRNVRLGLAADGFNPFRTMSTSHSTWPIVLIPYNLPPWMCMKAPYFMLSLLIPGPKSPKNKIDVYLQPLIDELKDLWVNGVETYDASRKETFKLHAALLWTLNDFPAYAMLSGWSTKGALACPCCNYDTSSQYLYHSRKTCYQGHRRFLSSGHRWRDNRRLFDGKKELRNPPKPLSGSKVFKLLKNVKVVYRRNPMHNNGDEGPWKKSSIFFELPYWKYNKLRHNLDVMHIEKNICDSLIGTLLNVPGKTKDHAKARYDLRDMGIREELHPWPVGTNKIFLPPACHTMSPREKDVFCGVLQGVKVPDGYASNISRCVQLKNHTVSGMKSHDCHFVLHYLLILAIRRTLPKNVVVALMELSSFYRSLCSRVLVPQDLERMEKDVVETLCKLEMIFPPTFFDVMVHLTVHLAREAYLGGPVQYRWMYSSERFFMKMKSYVRNRSHPEGSIAEGYLAEECLIFCSRYLDDDVETRFNRPGRNYDRVHVDNDSSILPKVGCPIGKGKMFTLDEKTWIQAHRYVLFNCNAIAPYIQEHRDILESQRRHHKSKRWNTAREHSEEFHEWFETRMMSEANISTEIKWLSRGPNNAAKRFKSYLVNGFRFRTKTSEKKRRTQNSGVIVKASTPSFASSRDQNPVVGEVTYYGVVKEIIELDYYGHVNVVLFKCDWFQTDIDQFGLPLVNFSRLIYENDPFVFASQVQQVFYVQDPIDTDWHVPTITIPRDLYDMGEQVQLENDDSFWLSEPSMQLPHPTIVENDENVDVRRNDVPGIMIDTSLGDDLVMGFEQGDDYEYDNDDEYFPND